MAPEPSRNRMEGWRRVGLAITGVIGAVWILVGWASKKALPAAFGFLFLTVVLAWASYHLTQRVLAWWRARRPPPPPPVDEKAHVPGRRSKRELPEPKGGAEPEGLPEPKASPQPRRKP